jgi:uncharacterized protein
LLKIRGELERAIRLGEGILHGEAARLVWVTPADVEAAWRVFSRFRDKGWSFTDCTSRVLIERLSARAAFSFDDHFRQFGNVLVVP